MVNNPAAANQQECCGSAGHKKLSEGLVILGLSQGASESIEDAPVTWGWSKRVQEIGKSRKINNYIINCILSGFCIGSKCKVIKLYICTGLLVQSKER